MRKKFFVVALVLVVAVTCMALAGCSEQNVDELVNSTNVALSNSKEMVAKEKVSLKNVDIAGIAKIQNLDIDIERTIKQNKTNIKIETNNNIFKLSDKVNKIIKDVLDILGKESVPQLKAEHIEQALSKIKVIVNADISEDKITGDIKVFNVKNMFSNKVSEPIIINIDLSSKDNEWVSKSIDLLREHMISEFVPTGTEDIKAGSTYDFEYKGENLPTILNGVLAKYGDNKINGSECSYKDFLSNCFGSSDAKHIIDKYITLSELKGSVTTNSIDKQKYIDSMMMNGKFTVNIDGERLDNIVDNITKCSDNKLIKPIYVLVCLISDFDEHIITGDIEMKFGYSFK